jgi:hypothetical protein
MDEQAQTQQPALPPQPATRKFLVVEIQGEPKMVESYRSLIQMEISTAVEFYRMMFSAGGKKKSKLPTVLVHDRQVE